MKATGAPLELLSDGDPASILLRVELTDSPRALLALTSILAARQVDVSRLEVGPVAGRRRSVLLEVLAPSPKTDHLVKYLNRSIDVLRVLRLDARDGVARAALVRIDGDPGNLAEAIALSRVYGAAVVSVEPQSCVLGFVADDARLNQWTGALAEFGPLTLASNVLMWPPSRSATGPTARMTRERKPR